MPNELDSLSKEIMVKNELGLHARPAAQIAKLAKKAKSGIWLIKDEEAVDATSIIDILSIACASGVSITIKIENPSDLDVLTAIAELVENGLDD